MTKIMLVEDDKSLREIYGVRLLAEGYDIVSAGDGEEALAMAIKERPQLIISDVMMPKVSGYDMLDILRSTTETKNIRVIMMTALSSEEQRLRAESLGADRYLVKSQVGIEDVVRVVHEVLEDTPETMAAAVKASSSPSPAAAPPPPTVPQPTVPVAPPTPLPQPGMPIPSAPSVPPVFATPSMPAAAAGPTPVKSQSSAPKPASLKTRIIQPLHDPSIAPVNINDLLDKELAKEAGLTGAENVVVETAEQEKASINEQLQSFVPPEPTPVEAPVDTLSTPVATPNPTLLPTPGVAAVPAATPPVISQQQPAAVPTPPPAAAQSASVTSAAPVVAPRPVPPSAVATPLPPVPPAPQVPLTPVVNRPAVTPLPVAVVAPTTPTPPTTPVVAPAPAQAAPSAPLTPSSEPVVDLTKLPEVPKVSDSPSV